MSRSRFHKILTKENLIFAIILFIGSSLRVWGAGYGLPFVFHPDENRQILDSLGMAERLSLLPEDLSYPALHKYFLIAVNGFYFITGKALGWFKNPSDFALKFLEGKTSVFLLGRYLSVAGGVLTGLAVYQMCKRLYSRRAGLIGFAYSMGSFHLIQHSQWAIADIFLALFTVLSLYYMAASLRENDKRSNLLAFVFTGLTIAIKPQGVFLLLPLALSQYFVLKDARRDIAYGLYKERLAGAAFLAVAAAFGNLSWLFDFHASYEKFLMLSQVAKIGISSKEPFTSGISTLVPWFFKELLRQEGPLGAVFIMGLVYAALRRKREDILFLSYFLIFMLLVKDWAIRYLHLFIAVFPALCVYGARFTDEFLSKARVKGAFAAALVFAVVFPSVTDSIEASVIKSQTDTRMLAKEWIEVNIPSGAPIALDWYEFAVPLWSEVPINLLNPKAKEHFASVPEPIRKGYAEFLKEMPNYKLLPVIYTTAHPNWPESMDKEAMSAASSKEVYRELYRVFNFHSIEELKVSGARYLIISSYGYTNFLLDDDPEKKTGMFNYLFKEDLLSFNRQSDRYLNDNRFGLLYFLNKRARDFYTPLLHGGAARLVKEFTPTGGTTGPVIKIYGL